MRHILTIEYEYVRVYINSLALQAVVERCTNNAGNSVNPHPTTPRGPLSPSLRSVNGNKDTLSTLISFSSGDQEYIKEGVDASRNLLSTVVFGWLRGDYLKHAPVRTYFRIISG